MIDNTKLNIIKSIKTGGQKEVYLAEHSLYGKVIYKKGTCQSSTSLSRIKREVEILKELSSNYYPKNFDFNFDSSGQFEIIEEYIEGICLSEYMAYFDTKEKVISFATDLVNGLKLIWDRRIVHRDIKPDNIIISKDNRPVIIDLGIARDLDDESLTKTIFLMGPCTPIYASPEQLHNKKSLIDIRSDFFSMGIILSQMLLNEHPFSPKLVGQGMSIVDNISNGLFSLHAESDDLSEELKQFLSKLLQNQPYNRYRTYNTLEDALRKLSSI